MFSSRAMKASSVALLVMTSLLAAPGAFAQATRPVVEVKITSILDKVYSNASHASVNGNELPQVKASIASAYKNAGQPMPASPRALAHSIVQISSSNAAFATEISKTLGINPITGLTPAQEAKLAAKNPSLSTGA